MSGSECAIHTQSDNDEEIARISCFSLAAEMDLHCLAGPRNMSVDLKYDVPCL